MFGTNKSHPWRPHLSTGVIYLDQNVPLGHSIFYCPVLELEDPKDLLLNVQTSDSTANLQGSRGAHSSLGQSDIRQGASPDSRSATEIFVNR